MHCHDMKMGEIYVCEGCGLEVKVVKECKDAGKPAGDCVHHGADDRGEFFCCGKDMKKKSG